jgi:type II secretory pathway component PulL
VRLCPLIRLLQAESRLGSAIVAVRVEVEDVLARPRERSSQATVRSGVLWLALSMESKRLQGEKGLLEPSAADDYIPLRV